MRLALAALMFAAIAHADEPPAPPAEPAVRAQSDLVAAIECSKRGFRYMLRLGRHDVLCLHTNIGARDAQSVDAVLKVRQEVRQ